MKILYYLPDLKNPFWSGIADGVKAEAHAKNYTLKIFSAVDNSEHQISQLQDYKTENPDAILISPVAADKVTSICKEIMKNNMPIIAVDQHMLHCVHASVMSGNITGGISAAQFIGDRTNNTISIVHVKAPSTYENAALRRKSFINETKRQENIIVRTLEGESLRETSKYQMQQFLKEKVEFHAVFAENDMMALGIVDALKQVNYSPWPIIVGFDGIKEAFDSIKNNEMAATVQQQPYEMGRKAVELIENIRHKLPYNEVVNISTRLITADNLP